MAQSSQSNRPSTASVNDRSDKPTRLNDVFIRTRFERLLDDSTSDEEETEVAESSDKDGNKKSTQPRASINRRTQQSARSEDDADEVILSVIWTKGCFGAAYYNVITSELFVMDEIMDDSNRSIIKALYRQCQPHYVLTTTAVPDTFLDVVKKLIVNDTANNQDDAASTSSSSSNGPVRVSLKLLPKKEHTYETCYHRVLCLKLSCEPDKATNAERRTFLNSLLNFKSRLMIHALGLLLKYVDVSWNNLALDATGHAEFHHICYIMLEDLVTINEDTYKTLAIIQSRFHPSLFKFGHQAKVHGMSLFTLLNRCRSRPGSLYLWKLLRHPTRDMNILEKRFEAINFFLDPNNQSVVESLKMYLGQVYRLSTSILNRYSAPQAKASDWSRLHKTLSKVICIGDICAEHINAIPIFTKIANSITSEMHIVRYFIEYIIDFEVSKIQGKLVIKSGVDPELDELNNIRQRLPELLSEMAEKDMEKYSLVMKRCRMIYVPDIRHVLAITEGAPSDIEDVPELDNTIGDVLLKITKRQSQIILRLVRYTSKHMGSILKSMEHCAELDTLLSFATVAREQNYVMPELVMSKTINIKRGRHPLKELLVNFVPNDTYSGDDGSLVKILTGPNACGKSVYLKQIALIVFMAHIGSFVPAESATIGIVTHILTQINNDDSLAQNASSFLLALRQVNVALYSSTPSSLVIIDEFGSGTTEIDGLALFTAVLQSFVERGIQCPHIFAATHIHRIVELLPQTPMIEAQTFDYMSNEANDLVFLYRIVSGKTPCSFAFSVAKSAGLDSAVIQRAREVFEAKNLGSLPTPMPNTNQENTIRHIMELLCDPTGMVNIEELKLWIRQAMAKPPYK